MRRWALVVVALYAAVLVLLTLPVFIGSFWGSDSWGSNKDIIDTSFEIFRSWQYWGMVVVLMLSQAALLIIPVKVSQKRPAGRRNVIFPVVTSAFLMGVLFLTLAYVLLEARYAFQAPAFVEKFVWVLASVLWVFWAIVFYRWSKYLEPKAMVDRMCRTMLYGSILELLVAVPTHVIVRNKDYCCAGFYTFTGLAFGLALAIFSFGPGLFFLFIGRAKRMQPAQKG